MLSFVAGSLWLENQKFAKARFIKVILLGFNLFLTGTSYKRSQVTDITSLHGGALHLTFRELPSSQTGNITIKKRILPIFENLISVSREVQNPVCQWQPAEQNLWFQTRKSRFFDEAPKIFFQPKCPYRVELNAYNQQISVNFTFYLI